MKKKIILLSAAAMMLFATTFAQNTDNGINEKVATAFSQKFARATNVNWEFTDTYYKAGFESNGQTLVAFFTEDGEKMGVARNILSTDLPINLLAGLNENYSEFWISDLFEHAADGTSIYYATIENADQKIILESVGSNNWSKFRKTSK